ncbi:GNAT family protein [Candidatus Gastranaerophilus sp. (ex Termes propinquus)]|nr:GNAT family protein [Candidatus Gastranaerophilus sp. (ex Termes propinquus)]
MYQTKVLSGEYFKIFGGVYNDFRSVCRKDYKFEIEPLDYAGFIEYFEKGFLECIILLEDDIPTGFLTYSLAVKDVVELFIIHILGDENVNEKRNALMSAFLQNIMHFRAERLISYPMCGKQAEYRDTLKNYGFEFVDLAVVVFDTNDKKKQRDLAQAPVVNLPIGYKVVPYRDIYFEELSNAIHHSFKNASDINFDPRFLTLDGSRDVADKIVNSIYGRFIPQASKVLLHENKLVGFCLANITAGSIGNIPLVGILQEHRGMGLSRIMLRSVMEDLLKSSKMGYLKLSEVNASVDNNNASARRMYRDIGFEDAYIYPQAYLPRISA